jgi:hypothetical protein
MRNACCAPQWQEDAPRARGGGCWGATQYTHPSLAVCSRTDTCPASDGHDAWWGWGRGLQSANSSNSISRSRSITSCLVLHLSQPAVAAVSQLVSKARLARSVVCICQSVQYHGRTWSKLEKVAIKPNPVQQRLRLGHLVASVALMWHLQVEGLSGAAPHFRPKGM